MWIVYTLVIIAVAVWLAGIWIRRGEDLAPFDQTIDASAVERFSRPDGNNEGHQSLLRE